MEINLNWFWTDFWQIDQEDKPEFKKEAELANKGAGVFLYISVDNVNEFYAGLVAKELEPASEPRDWP